MPILKIKQTAYVVDISKLTKISFQLHVIIITDIIQFAVIENKIMDDKFAMTLTSWRHDYLNDLRKHRIGPNADQQRFSSYFKTRVNSSVWEKDSPLLFIVKNDTHIFVIFAHFRILQLERSLDRLDDYYKEVCTNYDASRLAIEARPGSNRSRLSSAC